MLRIYEYTAIFSQHNLAQDFQVMCHGREGGKEVWIPWALSHLCTGEHLTLATLTQPGWVSVAGV